MNDTPNAPAMAAATPRTDNAALVWERDSHYIETTVPADAARELERELADLRAKLVEIETAAHGYTLCFPYAQVGSMKPALFKNGSYHYYVPEGEVTDLRAQLAAARKVIAKQDEALRETVDGLDKIRCESAHNIPYYAYGDNEAACDMSRRLEFINRVAYASVQQEQAALALTLPAGEQPSSTALVNGLRAAIKRADRCSELLNTISSETRPIAGHADHGALADCWREAFDELLQLEEEANACLSDIEAERPAVITNPEFDGRANVDQHPIPISEREPVFPCWLWNPVTGWHKDSGCFWCIGEITAVTHWLHDQPTAPTVTPKEDK